VWKRETEPLSGAVFVGTSLKATGKVRCEREETKGSGNNKRARASRKLSLRDVSQET